MSANFFQSSLILRISFRLVNEPVDPSANRHISVLFLSSNGNAAPFLIVTGTVSRAEKIENKIESIFGDFLESTLTSTGCGPVMMELE